MHDNDSDFVTALDELISASNEHERQRFAGMEEKRVSRLLEQFEIMKEEFIARFDK